LPVTPFHYPVAYVLYKLGGYVSLPALVVGSMVPDLEIPLLAFLSGNQASNRLVLHSILGSLTFGTAIAIAITVLIYPPIASAVFRVDKQKVKGKCQLSLSLVFSCAVGCLSHVLLDVTNHVYNPVFWPFLALNETPSPIVPVLGGEATASLLIHALMAALFVGLFVNKRGRFWERVLIE
jgi:membrane-bound metal-dependent hydrolase YbcI (DUF457 family)